MTRKQKAAIYQEKYGDIPISFEDRLSWMCDKYNLSESKMDEIIEKKRNMEYYLFYFDFVIILYEVPEGMPRPRYRFIGKKNYMDAAIQHPNFIHVYSPTAGDDFRYMRRLISEELIGLRQFVQTPCRIVIDSYFPTPSAFSISDVFMAEIGLHTPATKPDWDNIGKKYSDMYNHNIWLDDNLVSGGEVNKYYSILPRVHIHLKYLNYATNKYQYQNIINRSEYNSEFSIKYLDQKGIPSL